MLTAWDKMQNYENRQPCDGISVVPKMLSMLALECSPHGVGRSDREIVSLAIRESVYVDRAGSTCAGEPVPLVNPSPLKLRVTFAAMEDARIGAASASRQNAPAVLLVRVPAR